MGFGPWEWEWEWEWLCGPPGLLTLGDESGFRAGEESAGGNEEEPTPSLMACRAFRELLEKLPPPEPPPEPPPTEPIGEWRPKDGEEEEEAFF